MPPLATPGTPSAGRALALPKKWSGAHPLARDFNALLAAVDVLQSIRGENGIVPRVTQQGVVIGFQPEGVEMLAIVVGVWVNGERADNPGYQWAPALPSAVTYDVRVIGHPEIGTPDVPGGPAILRQITPTLGRPVKGDEVELWPCAVHDPCWVIRVPSPTPGRTRLVLRVDSEAISYDDCVSGGEP